VGWPPDPIILPRKVCLSLAQDDDDDDDDDDDNEN